MARQPAGANMQPIERKPTVKEMYAELDEASVMRRKAKGVDNIIHWRSEVGRLSDAIRRAQMAAGNSEREGHDE